MIKRCMLIGVIPLACISACANTQFEGQAANVSGEERKEQGKDDAGDDGDETADNPSSDVDSSKKTDSIGSGDDSGAIDIDGTDTSIDPGKPILTDEEIKIRRTECWFAVSGAYLASGQYNSTFPGTKSGKPVGHNEQFDDAGGVFLAASANAYLVGQGGKEIDLAVARTFDSIAIAPGMRAEIRDAADKVLYAGEGPVFLYSTEYGSHDLIFQASAYLKSNIATYPEWMQKILKEKSYLPERRPLHTARSVLVSKVPGKRCDY